MKKAIIGLVSVLGLAALGFVGVVSMQPSELDVARSVTIDAAPQDVAVWMVDLKKVNAWSPWNELDPDMAMTFSETTGQIGSSYSWEGNDEVGAGSSTIASIAPGAVTHNLRFLRPMESEALITLSWAESEAGKTSVTWGMKAQNDFMGKAAGLFMDMDELVGADFARGLGLLVPLAEKTREERVAAEEAARLAAAEAEAAAEGEEAAMP